jgi:HD-GYP domain-containing protein (c-di-GMP phosphodiesterase class II)
MALPRLSIHRTILVRLIPAWLLLSLVAGSAGYWMESRRVVGYAYDFASEEAERFDLARHQSLFEGSGAEHLSALKALLQESQFAALRLYGVDHQRLLEAMKQPDPRLARATGAQPRAFPAPGTHHHSILRIDGRFYVRVLVPLLDPDHRLYGYFEGLYLVPARTVRMFETRVAGTLAMVLIITTLTSLVLYPIIVALNRDTVQLSRSLLESVVELMRVLGSAVAKRDSDTDSHNYRVTLYATHLAETMGRPAQEISALIAGAFLHDVGKIGIPDHILLKPSELTEEELAVMKTHITIGEDIVSESRWLVQAREVVASHHEWFDGSGYLKGLKGEEIPYNARLFAIADVFDALTSRRPYKEPFPLDESLELMRQSSGRHFDPGLLAAFERIAPALYERYNQAGSAFLKERLTESILKYFPTS